MTPRAIGKEQNRHTETRVREQILSERHEYGSQVAELESEFICALEFWILLLPKVQKREYLAIVATKVQ